MNTDAASKSPVKPRRELARPRDVVDGIPDRSASRPVWKYVLLAVVFAAWLAVLTYVAVAD